MPDTGWRHDLAASDCSAAYNSFGAGGAASKGPMIEKRRRAQRSRLFGSVGVFKRVSRLRMPTASLVEVEITNPRGAWLSATSACGQHPSFSVTGCPTVRGERKTRSRINGSVAVPTKRSIRLAGSWLNATGGMKRAQAACQSGVRGNCSTHQFLQR